MKGSASPEERVLRLVRAARRIANPTDPLGKEARDVLPGSTGLSPAGVALALERCLETDPSEEEVAALVRSVHEAPRAHVLLSANVFVAAHRAIALGLAASDEVFVRPSRREPEMVRLLSRGAPDLFRVVAELEPSGGDHAFVYGSDETIVSFRQRFAPDVTVHAHGHGIGVVVLGADDTWDLPSTAEGIAEDVLLFDQRGCLSPRVVLVLGTEARATALAHELARALDDAERRVPRGSLDPDDAAEVARYRDTMRYGGVLLAAGAGAVGLDVVGRVVVVPPVGRHVQLVLTTDLEQSAAILRGIVVTVATLGPPGLEERAVSCFPGARRSLIGRMQRPPFDGPVDQRPERPTTPQEVG